MTLLYHLFIVIEIVRKKRKKGHYPVRETFRNVF